MTKHTDHAPGKVYKRFDTLQRFQHFFFLISFTLLAITGLPQKYPLTPISIQYFNLIGGVEVSRNIHHVSAIVMIIVSALHVLEVLYRLLVLRTPITMIPWITDGKHVLDDIKYYLGMRKHKAYYGRYSYAEKMEYLALIWGTVVMAATGFMMWNPLTTTQFLPGESIPAAKAAHGGEAILAVLAIIIWHFYHVHIKHLNKSMFTGYLSRHEMEHEHPAELTAIETGRRRKQKIDPKTLRQRQLIYAPMALIIFALTIASVYYLLAYETTAVNQNTQEEIGWFYIAPTPTTPPQPQPTATRIPTFTPRPTATPTLTATPQPTATQNASDLPAASPTPAPLGWEKDIAPILQTKCGMCHGANAATGLAFDSYASLQLGGKNGPIVSPGKSAESPLVTLMQTPGHPVILSPEELQIIIQWIDAGALE